MISEVDLTGRVALVTGSTRGIGRRTAEVLAAHGCTVVLHGRDQDQVDALATTLPGPGDHYGVTADLARPDAIKAVVQAIFRRSKRLDILVNNAGVLADGLIGMTPDDTVAELFDVNALAPVRLLHSAARLMKRSPGGSIINLTSIMGTQGAAGHTAYAASKASVLGLTLAAAKELAPDGIRVNAVAPGLVDTDMVGHLSDEVRQARIDDTGLGRIGTPDDVAQAILFLASDMASFVTGQVLGVDGGMHL